MGKSPVAFLIVSLLCTYGWYTARSRRALRQTPLSFALKDHLADGSKSERGLHEGARQKDCTNSIPASVHLLLGAASRGVSYSSDTCCEERYICEFYEKNRDSTLLACTSDRLGLEHFCLHCYGHNYSMDARMRYRKIRINQSDPEQLSKYVQLYEEGRFMTTSRCIEDDWKRKDPSMPEVSLSQLLVTSKLRILPLLTSQHDDAGSQFVCSASSLLGHSAEYCQHSTTRCLSKDETVTRLTELAQWFKGAFPYYCNQCLHPVCGNTVNNTYQGGVIANPSEKSAGGGARRTELYLCGACNTVSRFPRYLQMKKVVEAQRGRCGEYSVLMLRMLQGLGYTTRWVVDRDDHCWIEVRAGDEWIHVDPCEAAVDSPLMYHSWGKRPTFVLAYSACSASAAVSGVCVEDVTARYTSDDAATIQTRRMLEGVDEEDFQQLMRQAKEDLKSAFQQTDYARFL